MVVEKASRGRAKGDRIGGEKEKESDQSAV